MKRKDLSGMNSIFLIRGKTRLKGDPIIKDNREDTQQALSLQGRDHYSGELEPKKKTCDRPPPAFSGQSSITTQTPNFGAIDASYIKRCSICKELTAFELGGMRASELDRDELVYNMDSPHWNRAVTSLSWGPFLRVHLLHTPVLCLLLIFY